MSKAKVDERKTRLKTIRISESLARSLEEEAANEGTTVNASVNSILGEHIDWHKKTQEFGFVAIPNQLFKNMIEGLDDETLARIGREVMPAVWKEIAEYWSGDSSPDGILNRLMERSKFTRSFRTRITREEDAYTIVMHHDFGPKWSTITKNALQEFVKQSFRVEPRINVGESVVTAHFKVDSRNLTT